MYSIKWMLVSDPQHQQAYIERYFDQALFGMGHSPASLVKDTARIADHCATYYLFAELGR